MPFAGAGRPWSFLAEARAFSLLVCTANTVEVWLFLGKKATPKGAAL
jgi:hypothetical protein